MSQRFLIDGKRYDWCGNVVLCIRFMNDGAPVIWQRRLNDWRRTCHPTLYDWWHTCHPNGAHRLKWLKMPALMKVPSINFINCSREMNTASKLPLNCLLLPLNCNLPADCYVVQCFGRLETTFWICLVILYIFLDYLSTWIYCCEWKINFCSTSASDFGQVEPW